MRPPPPPPDGGLTVTLEFFPRSKELFAVMEFVVAVIANNAHQVHVAAPPERTNVKFEVALLLYIYTSDVDDAVPPENASVPVTVHEIPPVS